MVSVDLNLETVTPIFLHGSDNTVLELRPPSFKSLFRYWWRTVQDYEERSLREAEGKLFGSTDSKAPFSIRAPQAANLQLTKYKLLPHKRGREINAYEVDQQFSLHLIAKNKADASYYKQIAKLSFLLGGVGARSRRGFGSVRETAWNSRDVSSLQEEILDALNAVAKANRFQIKDRYRINGRFVEIIESKRRTHYPPEYPVVLRIFFGELTNDIDDLLVTIGKATSDAKRKNRDYTLGEGRPRMASPVIIRIQKVNNQYIPIATQLYSKYPRRTPRDIKRKQMLFINDII